jgi:multidrug transporter EmrE-like cation transporter
MAILIFIVLMVSGQTLFKAASLHLRDSSNPIDAAIASLSEWRFLLALAVYAAGTLLWMHILKQIPLSIAYPISMGSTIALTFLASHLIFGESYSASQAFGTALIITGVIAMSR